MRSGKESAGAAQLALAASFHGLSRASPNPEFLERCPRTVPFSGLRPEAPPPSPPRCGSENGLIFGWGARLCLLFTNTLTNLSNLPHSHITPARICGQSTHGAALPSVSPKDQIGGATASLPTRLITPCRPHRGVLIVLILPNQTTISASRSMSMRSSMRLLLSAAGKP